MGGWLRAGAAAVLVAAAASSCGGGSTPASVKAGAGTTSARLTVRDEAAQLRAKAAAAFVTAKDGDGLAVGDTVQTNGTGFVDVVYRDGSLTRLDANARLTLTELSDATRPQRVVGSMTGGRTWSRVQKITTSDGRFELDTPVATASVRGTQFAIDCTATDGSCTFAVVDGSVLVTPIGGAPVLVLAGESLTVKPDRTVVRNPGGLDVLTKDAWISRNLQVDAAEPLGTPTGGPTASPTPAGAAFVTGTGVLSQAEPGCTILTLTDGRVWSLGQFPGQYPFRIPIEPGAGGVLITGPKDEAVARAGQTITVSGPVFSKGGGPNCQKTAAEQLVITAEVSINGDAVSLG